MTPGGPRPNHPSLRFKKVRPTPPIYSLRIAQQYRALGAVEADEVVWFWVGSHDECEKLLSRL